MALRAKFMLIMSILNAVGMVALGVVLAVYASDFLFNQAKHKGIELTKMTAQVGRAVIDSRRPGDDKPEYVKTLLENARNWKDDGTGAYSDIDSIQFLYGPLNTVGVGNVQGDTSRGARVEHQVHIPRHGTVRLGQEQLDNIRIQPIDKVLKNGQTVPVHRFKAVLNSEASTPDQPSYVNAAEVWLDIRADTIYEVSRRFFIIVAVALALTMCMVIYASNLLARRITRPVRLLMRDMQVVAKGDLDHRTKPHSHDEIGVLAHEFDTMTQNLKVAQVALVEQEKAAYELSIAREVQQQLLPAEAPSIEGYSLSAFYRGARQVSGDYYDFIPLGSGLWGFIVADVSGKGVPGSMVMAVTRTIVRLVAQKHNHRAAETLKETNRLIAKQIKRGMFVTAFYAILEQATGRLVFSSAGHNPMVIYRHAQRGYELAQPKGIAIGFNEGPLFDKNIQEFETQLTPGDAILLYTDGFPEAMNEKEEEFGDERFYECVARYGAYPDAQDLIKALVAEVAQHRGRAAQSDDLTTIALKRQPI